MEHHTVELISDEVLSQTLNSCGGKEGTSVVYRGQYGLESLVENIYSRKNNNSNNHNNNNNNNNDSKIINIH